MVTMHFIQASEAIKPKQYDPLRDPNLKEHFARKTWSKAVVQQGLATKDMKVLDSDSIVDQKRFQSRLQREVDAEKERERRAKHHEKQKVAH